MLLDCCATGSGTCSEGTAGGAKSDMVNAQLSDGSTPLHIIAAQQQGHAEVVQTLVAAGAVDLCTPSKR